MDATLLHTLPVTEGSAPERMVDPYAATPHPWAQAAATGVISKVHAYMHAHPQSELHRTGKMFGVLVAATKDGHYGYLQAFSALLDGNYLHEGFVPPVYMPPTLPVGHSKEESQRLQQLLFAQYKLTNGRGEARNLLDLFAHEKPVVPKEEWFDTNRRQTKVRQKSYQPPTGAGECCAPKLLEYAFEHELRPLALAEFWIGAPPRNELRREGCYYTPCSGKCGPILRHMLQGVEIICPQPSAISCPIEKVYEDDWLMVVNKPAGILSMPGKSDEPSVAALLGVTAQPVHRLDQDTSGLLVLAKTPEVYKQLQAYFQRRDILKRYEAVVQATKDRLIPNEGDISLPLLPNPLDRPRQMVDLTHGKPAWTHFRVRERRDESRVFIDLYPHTGRTHQLRVHMAHHEGLDAPIVGDRLYGQAADRLLLHAAEIQFAHPITKEEMHFCIPSGF